MHFIVSFILFISVHAFAEKPPLNPDPAQTPGHLCNKNDADFIGYYYEQKIAKCKRKVSSAEKAQIYENYGIPKESRGNYTIDHFIPLSIGGSNSFKNLWPEHYKIKETRQNLELQVFMHLRDGKITQKEAIHIIRFEKMRDDIDPEW